LATTSDLIVKFNERHYVYARRLHIELGKNNDKFFRFIERYIKDNQALVRDKDYIQNPHRKNDIYFTFELAISICILERTKIAHNVRVRIQEEQEKIRNPKK
jgi:hypothetical protein